MPKQLAKTDGYKELVKMKKVIRLPGYPGQAYQDIGRLGQMVNF